MFGKSAEEIYDMMMDEFKDMEEAAVNFILQNSDAGDVQSDDHRVVDLPRSSLLQQILEAATAAKQISAGSVPAAIEDQLAKLSEPKLSWQDIVRVAFNNKRQEKGSINDWSRFRRRNLSMNMYVPRKKDQFIRWVAGLDTSGSMSRDDMAYGVSQLKCLDGRSEGIVVCWDAQVYWDKATKISGMNDLPNISIHGRGGTVIQSLLTDWRKHIREEVDMMIIMTDGYLYDAELKDPGIDVLWVITSENKGFKPPFGRVALLRAF
jgi:predicted metal-dependent peptidase